MNLGMGEIILIVFVALLLFGPKKLPELGKAVGNTLREFKNATKGLMDDEKNK
ncbi:twin-arginine translocase TatA/TatE family subunit [Metabacillus iocasae]|uniref:Sec-independent protein translocase protein TatA n=1 Tax=Priestia iocasae TaxID=2291674 RepID=A0ABS2QSK0_9BACI|nr:sec-independent protein translocase protein TatA [Metabacillus iocasae]